MHLARVQGSARRVPAILVAGLLLVVGTTACTPSADEERPAVPPSAAGVAESSDAIDEILLAHAEEDFDRAETLFRAELARRTARVGAASGDELARAREDLLYLLLDTLRNGVGVTSERADLARSVYEDVLAGASSGERHADVGGQTGVLAGEMSVLAGIVHASKGLQARLDFLAAHRGFGTTEHREWADYLYTDTLLSHRRESLRPEEFDRIAGAATTGAVREAAADMAWRMRNLRRGSSLPPCTAADADGLPERIDGPRPRRAVVRLLLTNCDWCETTETSDAEFAAAADRRGWDCITVFVSRDRQEPEAAPRRTAGEVGPGAAGAATARVLHALSRESGAGDDTGADRVLRPHGYPAWFLLDPSGRITGSCFLDGADALERLLGAEDTDARVAPSDQPASVGPDPAKR